VPLSKAERSAVNKRNAANAKGPVSEEGKTIASANALKHGLRARVHILPDEDPDEVQALLDEWTGHFNPQSPDAKHLLDQCVHSALLFQRVVRCQAAVMSKHMREAARDRDFEAADNVAGFAAGLTSDPDGSVRGLRQTALGCRYLINAWERLGSRLNDLRWWSYDELEEALRLLGLDPGDVRNSPRTWRVAVYHALLQRDVHRDKSLTALFNAENRPGSTVAVLDRDSLPSNEEALQTLKELVASQLEELLARESYLRTTIEQPDLASVQQQKILVPTDENRLLLRYHAEARTSFSRTRAELLKTLARDAKSAAERAETESEETPAEASAAAETAISPNEPNLDANPSEETASEPSDVPDPAAPGEPSEAAPETLTDSDTSMSPEWPISPQNGGLTTPLTAPTAPPA